MRVTLTGTESWLMLQFSLAAMMKDSIFDFCLTEEKRASVLRQNKPAFV